MNDTYYAIYFADSETFLRGGPRDEVLRFMTRNGAQNAIATLSRCVNRECVILEMHQ